MGIRSDLARSSHPAWLGHHQGQGRRPAALRRLAPYPQYSSRSPVSIDMIWAPGYGSSKKNATDIRLAVDAWSCVHRPGDRHLHPALRHSDFASLSQAEEYGKYVIGVGIRESSSDCSS